MNRIFFDVNTDDGITLRNFYKSNINPPDSEVQKQRAIKVAEAIQTLGDKYLLAKPVERKDGPR